MENIKQQDVDEVLDYIKTQNLASKSAKSSIDNCGKFALTTLDNPYDPFTEYSDWLMFDISNGYNSNAYLARIAHTSEQLSDYENDEEIERAIDEILENDFLGIYTKVINKNY